jgi:hypothetical protein
VAEAAARLVSELQPVLPMRAEQKLARLHRPVVRPAPALREYPRRERLQARRLARAHPAQMLWLVSQPHQASKACRLGRTKAVAVDDRPKALLLRSRSW